MNGVANLSLSRQSSMGEISFVDLKAQQRLIRERIEQRIKTILDHGRYIGGPEIEELELELARRTGAEIAVACASGTAALIIPLLAWKIERRDAIFVPSFTYNATANAVILAGGTPVFVDIDPETFTMDPADLAQRIEAVKREGALRPFGVIPVDLFGSPADYRTISAISAREGLRVLADGAQSYGGRLDGRWVGDLAPVTATSFFPGKSLGAYGDAGAVLAQEGTDREVWASLRWHGTDESRKISVRVGFNGRMDSFQAAVLLEKLSIFDAELGARHRVAAIYNERLKHVGSPQRHLEGAQSGYGYYALCVDGRDAVIDYLDAHGVPTAIYYATPLHKMPAFERYAPEGGLPHTERVAERIFSLPMHPYLTPDEVHFICDAVESALRSR
jgi:UDP-2-acetamido-2-deoxy-ribo-hexuluronate aminotransferase